MEGRREGWREGGSEGDSAREGGKTKLQRRGEWLA